MSEVQVPVQPAGHQSRATAPPDDAVLPVAPFLVIASQRTGSGWLMDRINNVPGAQGHMALFYHDVRKKPAMAGRNDYPRFVESRDQLGSRPRAVFTYLDRLYTRRGPVGFKVMHSQLSQYPELLLYLVLRRPRVVHLVRMNHLDVVISEALARATGTSHATSDGSEQAPIVVEVDPGSIVQRVRRLERKQQMVRQLLRVLPCPVLEVSYESLYSDDDAFIRVCRFIGAAADSGSQVGSRLVKRQRSPHREVLRNYADVAAALTRGGYQRLLH